jgi:hypothetical protein
VASLLIVTCLFATPGWADDPETQPATTEADAVPQRPELADATINRLLDEPVGFDLSSQPLPDVLEQITRQTNVPFHVPDQTYQNLPYGRQTPISVSVTATPLRQTIAAIGQRLGLRYRTGDGRVELLPLPALQRIGRRATVEEVGMLDLLGAVRLDLVEDRPTVAQLLEAIDLKLQAIDDAAREAGRTQPGYKVETQLDDGVRGRPVSVARDSTLAVAMEAITQQTSATWYPESDKLVVMPKEKWVLRSLQRPVQIAYDRVELQQVLADLERVTGLRFRIAPGALSQVDDRYRQVQMYLEDATAQEALDTLGGVTGLAWEVDPSGVYLWHAASDTFDTRRPRQPVAGFRNTELPVMTVDLGDGRTLLIYESELPREAREALARRRADAIEQLAAGDDASESD